MLYQANIDFVCYITAADVVEFSLEISTLQE